MKASPTLLYNAASYQGSKLTGPGVSVPGLLGGYNRTFQLAEGLYDEATAVRIVEGNAQQGLQLIACLHAGNSVKHCAMLAARWPHLVFELGNEGDSDGSDPALNGMWWLQQEAAIRSRVPDARVILGSIQSLSGHGLETLKKQLAAYGQRPPAISVHVYTDAQLVGETAQRIEWVRGVLRSFCWLDVPIWVTEYGHPGASKMDDAAWGTWHRALLRQFRDAGVEHALMWAADDGGSFGMSDRARLKRLWNKSLRDVGVA